MGMTHLLSAMAGCCSIKQMCGFREHVTFSTMRSKLQEAIQEGEKSKKLVFPVQFCFCLGIVLTVTANLVNMEVFLS